MHSNMPCHAQVSSWTLQVLKVLSVFLAGCSAHKNCLIGTKMACVNGRGSGFGVL